MNNPDVLTIVSEYLKASEYDGLWSDSGCACLIGDLAPCGEIMGDCTAGYRIEGCTCGEGCDFHINREKADHDL